MLTDLPNAGEVTHTDSQLYDMAGNAFLGFGLIRSDSSILVTLTATAPYPLHGVSVQAKHYRRRSRSSDNSSSSRRRSSSSSKAATEAVELL